MFTREWIVNSALFGVCANVLLVSVLCTLLFCVFSRNRCYVFNGQSITRSFCNQKSIVFIMSDCNNHTTAAGFFCHCLQNLSRNETNMRPSTDLARVRFNPRIWGRERLSMTVSNGDGQHLNMQSCIGFTSTRYGRVEGMFSEINARTAHMRRRPRLGQTWHFSGVL